MLRGTWPAPGRTVWAYPLVGLLVGGAGGLAYAAACWLGLPPPLAACWSLAATTLLTGALHEDGLADTADGFGGGRDRTRKLEIMRDSRIGSYGAIALIGSYAARGLAIAALARPGAVLPALAASGALGRGGIVLLLTLLRPARPDGLAALLGGAGPARVAGLGLAAMSLLLLPAGAAWRAGGAALLLGLGVAGLARRQVGGHTGDVLGAASVVVECGVLSALAAWHAG